MTKEIATRRKQLLIKTVHGTIRTGRELFRRGPLCYEAMGSTFPAACQPIRLLHETCGVATSLQIAGWKERETDLSIRDLAKRHQINSVLFVCCFQ